MPFRTLGVTSRDGSPKGPFPSIRFLVLRGYFWASALRIDFCTRGVRYRCVVRRAPSGYERRNRRDGCTCGNLASRRSRTEHNSRLKSIFLSNAIRRQNSENNRNKTSEFYRRSTYRRTRSLAARPGSNEDCLTVVHRKMLNTADHNKLESRRGAVNTGG
jgi:hypothetical protein